MGVWPSSWVLANIQNNNIHKNVCYEAPSQMYCMLFIAAGLLNVLLKHCIRYYFFNCVFKSGRAVKGSMFRLVFCRSNVTYNTSSRFNAFLCGFLAIFLPAITIVSFLVNAFVPEELGALVGEGLATTLYVTTV